MEQITDACPIFGRVGWRPGVRLRARGLPAICAPHGKTLDENDRAASNIFDKSPQEKDRRLVLAFDRTYLTNSLQLVHAE